MKVNFDLVQKHNYSFTELDNMLPYEREIYITMLNMLIDEKNNAARP